jgi:hypothetical protein
VASISFSVVETPASDRGKPTLTLDKTEFQSGEEIRVRFTAPEGLAHDAWIGIIPSQTPHGEEAVNDQHDLDFQYLMGETQGVLVFAAPEAAGAYDFRMHDTDDEGLELASVSFRVTAGAEPEPEPESESGDTAGIESIFPLPDDLREFVDMAEGETVTFQTGMTQDEVIAFYRQALTDMGLVERPILTVIEEGTFSMVFDGWEDGRSVVVQGVDFGDIYNVSIRLEEV